MADRVIIVDIHRGKTKLPVTELVQMKGRCARTPGQIGIVDFIVSEDDVEELKVELKNVDNLRVDSVLPTNIAFHIVSEISRGTISTFGDVEKWYSRSFASFLNMKVDLVEAVENLVEWQCITKRGKMYFPTEFAHISSQFYFHPADVYHWRNNFLEVFDNGHEENDCAIAWALSNVYKLRVVFDVSMCGEVLDDYKSQLSSCGYEYEGTLPTGLTWWRLLGGPQLKQTKIAAHAMQDDFGRIHKALLKINECCKMDHKEFFENLAIRVYHRVPQHLVSLCRIDGVTKNLAMELYNNYGVHNYDDFVENIEIIKNYGSERLIKIVSELNLG